MTREINESEICNQDSDKNKEKKKEPSSSNVVNSIPDSLGDDVVLLNSSTDSADKIG